MLTICYHVISFIQKLLYLLNVCGTSVYYIYGLLHLISLIPRQIDGVNVLSAHFLKESTSWGHVGT